MPLRKTSSEHVSAERLGMAAFCLNALSSGVEIYAWMGMLKLGAWCCGRSCIGLTPLAAACHPRHLPGYAHQLEAVRRALASFCSCNVL